MAALRGVAGVTRSASVSPDPGQIMSFSRALSCRRILNCFPLSTLLVAILFGVGRNVADSDEERK